MGRLLRHLNYSNVVATLCLMIVLGGGAYAAEQLSGKRLKDRSVPGKKLKRNSVGSAEVRNRSLLANDFRRGQLPSGPAGPRGEQGPAGTAPAAEPWRAVGPETQDCQNDTGRFCGIHAPGFEALWSNYDSAPGDWQPVAFRKDGLGQVELRGVAKQTVELVSGPYDVVFYLPAGYRPSRRLIFATDTTSGHGSIEIGPNGAVRVAKGSTTNSTSSIYASVSPVRFQPEG